MVTIYTFVHTNCCRDIHVMYVFTVYIHKILYMFLICMNKLCIYIYGFEVPSGSGVFLVKISPIIIINVKGGIIANLGNTSSTLLFVLHVDSIDGHYPYVKSRIWLNGSTCKSTCLKNPPAFYLAI